MLFFRGRVLGHHKSSDAKKLPNCKYIYIYIYYGNSILNIKFLDKFQDSIPDKDFKIPKNSN